jgi:endonuclease III
MAKSRAVQRAPDTLRRLQEAHPDAHCELEFASPFQLLVATVLSAQSTDVAVNRVSPDLFRRWPTAETLATADQADVESVLNRLGMFRQKAKNTIGLAKLLVAEHGGEVPRTLAELVKLPGVGRKTANVVLGVAFHSPEGVVVDTHVQRISQRLGWTRNTTPEAIERDLMKLFDREQWDPISHTLIFQGRRVCTARKPACSACAVADACPSAFNAEWVGRKTPRPRVHQQPATSRKTPGGPSGKTASKASLSKRSTPTSGTQTAPKKPTRKKSR